MWPRFLSFLTANYPLEKHLFLLDEFSLRTIGYWPASDQSFWISVYAIFNYFVLTYCTWGEVLFGIFHFQTDAALALDSMCSGVTNVMSWIKLLCIWWYRTELKAVITNLRRLLLAEDTLEKNQIKRHYIQLVTRLIAALLFSGLSVNTTFFIRVLHSYAVKYFSSTPIIGCEMPIQMILPEMLNKYPWCIPITWLAQYEVFIVALSFVGGDALFISFSLYLSVLLKTLSLDLKAVLNEQTETNLNICKQLKEIIERHDEIIELTKKFNQAMKMVTFCYFVTSSTSICMCVILLLFSGFGGSSIYIFYAFALIVQLFIYCYGGTTLAEASTNLADVAYSSHWYTQNVQAQKMTLLILVRAQRAIVFQVPFFKPCMPTFASIMKFAASLMTLLQSNVLN